MWRKKKERKIKKERKNDSLCSKRKKERKK